jgi:hypothetical protein
MDADASHPTVPLQPPPPERRGGLWRWIVIGLAALFALQICVAGVLFTTVESVRARALNLINRPSVEPPPDSPRDTVTEQTDAPVLIEENFDQPTTRWDQSLSQVVDGAYEMRVDIPNFDSYGLLLSAGEVDDFDMAVDVQQVAGDPTSEYGIRFRQSGPGDYLMFSISGSGYYRLLRVSDDEYRSLTPWTFDYRIKTGADAVNRLRVVAQDADITFYVNDAELIKAQDDVNVGGQLTLGVTTFEQGGLVVRFDNIAGNVGEVDLAQDFSDPKQTQWSTGGAIIAEQAYELSTNGGVKTWQQPLPTGSSDVGDFKLQVDVTLLSEVGEEDFVAYGVMFGDGGSFDFYSFYLLPQGGIAMFRSQPGGQDEQLLPAIPLDFVKQGPNETNRIEIEVRSGKITITINDEALPELENPEPIRGMVGIVITSDPPVRVRFDNFRLEELE